MTPHNVILITGANGSIGQAIAFAFLSHEKNAFVWLGVHSNTSHAESIVKQFPERSSIISLDVTDQHSWASAVAKIIATSGSLDVLVNNAGHHDDALLAQMSQDKWNNIINLNLNSVFLGCQSVLPAMIGNRYGRIVNISSLSAILAPMGQTNYAAAKAGVLALTQSLAKEVARIGITVNAVCPGFISESEKINSPEEMQKAIDYKIPMRRFGKPSEVAATVRFLCNREASYVTGSVLKVDGGIL
jgi:3-oxoacyl-[acyl-carrier protein] reductase